MRRYFFIVCYLMFLSLNTFCSYADSEYRKVNTSQGKVIVGLDKDAALEKFGLPTSVTEDLWYYPGPPETFFVYFPSASLLAIHLYPRFCEGSVDVPIEFKALGDFSDFQIKDITSEVELLLSEPKDFILKKPAILIPKREGRYQILMRYKDIFSNPSNIIIKKSKREAEKERLLSINVLPFKPIIPYQSKLEFIALGTFFNSSEGKYFIRDISSEAQWFIRQGKNIMSLKDNQIYSSFLGKFKVFSKFRDLESFPQEAEVKDINFLNQALKHITLLPEFILVPLEKKINLRAFGTYYHNKVEDITHKVRWKISDKDIVLPLENGEFLSKSLGITEVIAKLDDLESLPVKIIVIGKKDLSLTPVDYKKTEERKISSDDLIGDITKDAKRLSKSFEERRLSLIKIIPDYLRIPLGDNRQLAALGVYTNNTEEDLTLLGEWISSDNRIATVSKGKVSTLSLGEIKIHAKFQGVKSIPASVIVEGPKLISIIISPQNSQISMKDKLNLKAEGYFSDSSRKDIISLVTWEITNSRIIKIEKGVVRPLRIGETQVYAGYSGIKSLPASIKVIFTIQWLLEMIFIIISFLILSIIILFSVLYFITKHEKNKLLSLYKNPRDFIISLYDNLKGILIIFGIRYKEVMAPLTFAELIEKRYSIKDNLFLRFTEKFEEAKYSKHILQFEYAYSVLNDYNGFLKVLFSNHNKFFLLLRYCLTLLHRRPLSIISKSLQLAKSD